MAEQETNEGPSGLASSFRGTCTDHQIMGVGTGGDMADRMLELGKRHHHPLPLQKERALGLGHALLLVDAAQSHGGSGVIPRKTEAGVPIGRRTKVQSMGSPLPHEGKQPHPCILSHDRLFPVPAEQASPQLFHHGYQEVQIKGIAEIESATLQHRPIPHHHHLRKPHHVLPRAGILLLRVKSDLLEPLFVQVQAPVGILQRHAVYRGIDGDRVEHPIHIGGTKFLKGRIAHCIGIQGRDIALGKQRADRFQRQIEHIRAFPCRKSPRNQVEHLAGGLDHPLDMDIRMQFLELPDQPFLQSRPGIILVGPIDHSD